MKTILTFIMLCPLWLSAQNLYVKEKTGNTETFAISDLRKLSFPGNDCKVEMKDGSTNTFQMDGVRYLSFTDYVENTSVNNVKNDFDKAVFSPVPVHDVLNIQYRAQKNYSLQIDIIDMQGKIVINKAVTIAAGNNNITIDLENLPNAIYNCRIQNGSSVETKQLIKQ